MKRIERRIKIALHKDLASHPLSHAWLLNLYRVGEDHHLTVQDYFPYQHSSCKILTQNLKRHQDDENRHGQALKNVLLKKTWPLQEFAGYDVYNNVVRYHTAVSFHIQEEDSPDIKRKKLAHFLAHAHFLEARVAQSLAFHIEACEQIHEHEVFETLAMIQRDENRHVAYTRQAVFDLLPKKQAWEVLDFHECAEKKANAEFSRHHMQVMLQEKASHFPKHHYLLFKLCVFMANRAQG